MSRFTQVLKLLLHTLGALEGLWLDKRWRVWEFMPGALFESDDAPAVYFRPGMIPGDDISYSHAMMCGYFQRAQEESALIKAKSSGQTCQLLQTRVFDMLEGRARPATYAFENWRYGNKPIDLDKDKSKNWLGDSGRQAEVLKKRFLGNKQGANLVLLDEPEQSLDTLAQLRLWAAIKKADKSRVQVIVATHSPLPLMEPGEYHFIETVPGYVDETLRLLKS